MLMPVRSNKISARTFVKTGKGHYTDRHRDSRTGKGGREETWKMKRVYCLYRVSTAQQVDVVKDDIPMQRIACHDFAARMGWTILVEKEEKGISGFKVSAEKRDAIQELKEAALNKEFDVLLVFMFDRLGRIENETPFVLEWFADHGIEVWSVNEGQQKFDQHVDKLMNYIRFWQASGESEKTSIRVKTRMHQMVAEGIYTGGSLPYGYMLVDKGRKNKKGQVMRDLAVCPEEAEVVKALAGRATFPGRIWQPPFARCVRNSMPKQKNWKN